MARNNATRGNGAAAKAREHVLIGFRSLAVFLASFAICYGVILTSGYGHGKAMSISGIIFLVYVAFEYYRFASKKRSP